MAQQRMSFHLFQNCIWSLVIPPYHASSPPPSCAPPALMGEGLFDILPYVPFPNLRRRALILS